MARGTTAKKTVAEKLKEAFGADYVGEFAGKQIVWADDGGERVQIAIAMTCPKTIVGEEVRVAMSGGMEFSDGSTQAETPAAAVEITPDEEKNISDLIAALGL